MEIMLKYFGTIADITAKKEELVFVGNEPITLKKLQSEIEVKYPKILDVNYSMAINKKISNCDIELKDSDEVAFLPPFAGG
jgi:sulfur-carrier protein